MASFVLELSVYVDVMPLLLFAWLTSLLFVNQILSEDFSMLSITNPTSQSGMNHLSLNVQFFVNCWSLIIAFWLVYLQIGKYAKLKLVCLLTKFFLIIYSHLRWLYIRTYTVSNKVEYFSYTCDYNVCVSRYLKGAG